jgi:hypothetical protein
MILLYLLCALVGVGVYAVARRMARLPRVALAASVSLLLAVLATAAIVSVGDRPLPGSITVTGPAAPR